MPDTGPPWNIPYVEPTDLVRDYPQASEDLADAIADGLDAAGGLVAVKHALFTGTQSVSLASGANAVITDLTIAHTVADSSNKIILFAQTTGNGNVGIMATGFAVDGSLIDVGDAEGNRTRVGSISQVGSNNQTNIFLTSVYEPGDTSSHTYDVRVINVNNSTLTNFVNRSDDDSNIAGRARSASSFVLMEVKV